MEIAELVLKFLQALVWPIVAVVAVVVFRRQLAGLFARITEASIFGATIKLEESAERAAAKSDDIPELSDPLARSEPVEKINSPQAAAGSMISAWAAVESVTARIGQALSLTGSSGRSPSRIVRELYARDLISAEAFSVAQDLQSVRNQLVHGGLDLELSISAAANFVEAAEQLRVALTVALGRILIGSVDTDVKLTH